MPANAYTGTLAPGDLFFLAYMPIVTPTADLEATPGNFTFAGMSFVLESYINDMLLSDTNFATPLMLEIVYPASLVEEIQPEELTLLYWNTQRASNGKVMESKC